MARRQFTIVTRRQALARIQELFGITDRGNLAEIDRVPTASKLPVANGRVPASASTKCTSVNLRVFSCAACNMPREKSRPTTWPPTPTFVCKCVIRVAVPIQMSSTLAPFRSGMHSTRNFRATPCLSTPGKQASATLYPESIEKWPPKLFHGQVEAGGQTLLYNDGTIPVQPRCGLSGVTPCMSNSEARRGLPLFLLETLAIGTGNLDTREKVGLTPKDLTDLNTPSTDMMIRTNSVGL